MAFGQDGIVLTLERPGLLTPTPGLSRVKKLSFSQLELLIASNLERFLFLSVIKQNSKFFQSQTFKQQFHRQVYGPLRAADGRV